MVASSMCTQQSISAVKMSSQPDELLVQQEVQRWSATFIPPVNGELVARRRLLGGTELLSVSSGQCSDHGAPLL